MSLDINIRKADVADLSDINDIYNYYVANSTCVWSVIPCSGIERQEWYEGHDKGMPILVAEYNGRIVGWGALSTFREAYTIAGTLDDAIYVHHNFHQQGIGSRLLKELINIARKTRLHSILANISADQEPSIRLHENFGFEKVAHIRQVGWKFNKRLDAVYLQLLLKNKE